MVVGMTPEDAIAMLRAAAHLAARRGSLLFHLDLAAELAKAALDQREMPTDLLAPLAGPVGYEVLALRDGASVRAVAHVSFGDDGTAAVAQVALATSARAEAVARARRTLANVFPDRTGLVVPRSEPGVIEGYAVNIATHPGPLVAEGHMRCLLAPTGRAIVSRESMSLGRVGPDNAFDSDAAVPSELHVYLSLKHGRTLSIATAASRLTWTIEGERITLS